MYHEHGIPAEVLSSLLLTLPHGATLKSSPCGPLQVFVNDIYLGIVSLTDGSTDLYGDDQKSN